MRTQCSARASSTIARRTICRRSISIHGAREHNLKNIDVTLPRNKFTVITGVSGSGKSTLAFDIVFGEGQRRYLESLNAYARQFVQPASRPDVDAIFGIPPTVAIEQRTSRGGRKSTVATLTEIYHFLRLMYVKLGTQYCPTCNVSIEPQSFDAIAARVLKDTRADDHVARATRDRAQGLSTRISRHGPRRRAIAHLRVDGGCCRPGNGRDWIDSRSTRSNCRSRRSRSREDERELRRRWRRAGTRQGHGARRVRRRRAQRNAHAKRCSDLKMFSTRRACPSCGTVSLNWIRACSRSIRSSGGVKAVIGTGVAIPGLRCRAER